MPLFSGTGVIEPAKEKDDGMPLGIPGGLVAYKNLSLYSQDISRDEFSVRDKYE